MYKQKDSYEDNEFGRARSTHGEKLNAYEIFMGIPE
jgi:hypothetical protein